MKKIGLLLFGIICLIATPKQVLAKDTIYSINKYSEEELKYIVESIGNHNDYVTAGTYQKEIIEQDEKEYEDIQVMLVKYDNTGKIIWDYNYGKTTEDEVYSLFYSYNEEKEKNGYIIVVKSTKELDEEDDKGPLFIMINDKGKQEKEMDTSLPKGTIINQVIEYRNKDKELEGYLVAGQKNEDNQGKAFLAKYDLSLNQEWIKEYKQTDNSIGSMKEIIVVQSEEEPHIIGLLQEKVDEKDRYHVLKMTNTGEFETIVENSFEEKDIPHLLSNTNSYLIYGYTTEVKIDKKNSISYYIKKYNMNDEEEWETIGDTEISKDKPIQLQPILENEEIKEYHLMYINGNDKSIEIIRIDKEGLIQNKIKKIKNSYYKINAFLSKNNTIYFIGQINCPEDDNCDYDTNSLFLISDEDKVIEVKDNDSKNILLATTILIIGSIVLYGLRKRKKVKKEM